MLVHLHIRDFAIIDDSEIEPGTGLSALTGETGAGKSILLDALGLVLGERASADKVRDGARRAEVTARFELPAASAASGWLKQQALDNDDGECVLRRVVNRSGKSQASINGSQVTLATLREFGSMLVFLHGQSAHHKLAGANEQRRLLDAFSPSAKLQRTQDAWQQWQALQKQLDDALRAETEHQHRRDLLEFQLQEFDKVSLDGLSVSEIEQEHRWLADAERSQRTGETIQRALNDSAIPALLEAARPLQDLAAIDAQLQEALDLVESASIQASEAVRMVTSKTAALESDDARLAWLDERLSALHALAKKHRCDLPELPDIEDRLRDELDTLNDPATSADTLIAARDEAQKAWLRHALALSQHRKRAAKKLGDTITASMQALAMEGGVFEVRVLSDETRADRHGLDRVVFDVSPNPGVAPAPLAQIASGGELSRIGLALQLACIDSHDVSTLIFDEVDAGIGGAVGETLGRLLRQLGNSRQVLCVTHLAQVAVQAHTHLQVTKSVTHGHTETRLQRLDRQQRRDEIARMLGGARITAKTRQHADEMLDNVE